LSFSEVKNEGIFLLEELLKSRFSYVSFGTFLMYVRLFFTT